MGAQDKAKNTYDDAKGHAKEWVGDKTDNPDLEEEGREDQAKAKAKQAGEHVKDAVEDVKDAFKR